MTPGPGYCLATDPLARAAEIMRTLDCGVVPVVDAGMEILGMITDRDIAMTLASRNKKASEVKVGDSISGDVVSCRPDDKIGDLLKLMKKNQIHRLPVRGADRKLVGIVSIRDVILAAEKHKGLRKKAYSALGKISRPGPILLHEISGEES